MASSPLVVNRRKHSRGLKKVFNLIDAQSASKFYPIDCQISPTDHGGNVSQEFVAPFDGFVVGLDSVVQAAIASTGGTIQLQLNAVNVAGALLTLLVGDAKGSRKSASFTKVAVSRGDRLTIVLAGFTTGAANIQVGMSAN